MRLAWLSEGGCGRCFFLILDPSVIIYMQLHVPAPAAQLPCPTSYITTADSHAICPHQPLTCDQKGRLRNVLFIYLWVVVLPGRENMKKIVNVLVSFNPIKWWGAGRPWQLGQGSSPAGALGLSKRKLHVGQQHDTIGPSTFATQQKSWPSLPSARWEGNSSQLQVTQVTGCTTLFLGSGL